ncbi:MAG: trypsin-like peptidase domain-containing protein, partial [Gaiellales bacterium]
LRLEQVSAAIEDVVGWGVARRINQASGALLNMAVLLSLAWFAAALAAIVPTDSPTLTALRNSSVFGRLVAAVPPQGNLGSIVLRSGLVPAVNGPLVLAEPPDLASVRLPAVLAARASVLQVRSTACDKIVKGTGWVAGPGIIITNAHVVAGSRRSFLAGGPSFDGSPAIVTHFDPVNDVAVLVLESSNAQLPAPLRIVSRIKHGEKGAVIGFPNGGEQKVVAARVDRVALYDVNPLGGGDTVATKVLAFRANVAPGNSGGPLVAEDGAVLGLVVAKGLGQRVEAAYGVASAELLQAISNGSRRRPVPTGRCLTDQDLHGENMPASPDTPSSGTGIGAGAAPSGAGTAPGSGTPPGLLPPEALPLG